MEHSPYVSHALSGADSQTTSYFASGLPPPLDLTRDLVKLYDQYLKGGGFGDVYMCQYNSSSGAQKVAVKALRFTFDDEGDKPEKGYRMLHRELGIWRRLNHKNIVPFLGIAYGFGMHGAMSLVSSWMPNGTLDNLLKKYDENLTIAHRLQLLLNIAHGLEYLHSPAISGTASPVIHGDLNPNNVLIDADYTARLTDFGFASFVGEIPEALAYLRRSTTRPGALRWVAPEQISLDSDGTRTTKSDVYSFGNIALQVLSSKHPWSEVRGDNAIVLLLHQGRRPARPEHPPIDDRHWEFINLCWLPIDERPEAGYLVATLRQLLSHYPNSRPLSDLFAISSIQPAKAGNSEVAPDPSSDVDLGDHARPEVNHDIGKQDRMDQDSSSGQETASQSNIRLDETDKVVSSWGFKRVASQKALQQPDLPVDSVNSFDEYTAATNGLRSRRPLNQLDSDAISRASPRPVLEVATEHSHGTRGGTSNATYGLQSQPRPRGPRHREHRDSYQSTPEEHSPPPEDVYERLEEFFPEHELDEPFIVVNSGGTSTAVEPADPPNRIRGKKSVRIVAEEHKRRLDRTSRAQSSYGNLLRRSTKLWGGHVEEVTTSQEKPIISGPMPDVPAGGFVPKPIFKWVRGELLRKGTYARIYLALNATTGEMITMKQVPTTRSDKSDSRQAIFMQALKLEIETLKDLDHPHIVAYLGFEETPDFLSSFLEYVPGGSIRSCLRDHGKFDEDVTKSFTTQILDGLVYLHSKNIIHRDLQADNILVEKTGVCKISEFGISKRADDDHAAYIPMQGTAFWMAPEVIGNQNGRGYNSKIDIWSIGCIVLEMWSGRPWPDESFLTSMLKVSHDRKSPPIPANVILSDLAFDFKKRCLAINPDDRASAAELIQHPYLQLPEGWVFPSFW